MIAYYARPLLHLWAVAVLLSSGALGMAAGAAPSCTGDCNHDGSVEAVEILVGVRMALQPISEEACSGFDHNVDSQVTIEELVESTRLAQAGCPTPMPTAVPTAASTTTPTLTPTPGWQFIDVTIPAGLAHEHRYVLFKVLPGEKAMFMGGVAAGDYDRDGWIDLYTVGGDAAPNRLFRNLGDGAFEETTAGAGVEITGERGNGPLFADYDGDGWLDLFLGGVEETPAQLYRNRNGTFEKVTQQAGLAAQTDTFSAAFGDYDRDGDLDLIVTRWGVLGADKITVEHLWRNNGDGTFAAATHQAGLADLGVFLEGDENNLFSYTFTPNFADIDNDGWPDLLVAADFGSSRVFRNQRNGTFANVTTQVISDENGMGAAVGDYDNDGDLDWFVSSIHDPNGMAEGFWGVSGNRLYQNQGDGTFTDATTAAGVREGFWGWGSCFADFNNDGFLDIFHVNGMGYLDDQTGGIWLPGAEEYYYDPARLFVSNGDGTFTDRAAALGVADTGQGRGIVCFDFDRDGDIDVFIASNGQAARLYRNDGGTLGNFLTVKLRGDAPNREGIGARVYVSAGAQTQMREIRAGSNFESQDPAMAHFGLGSATTVGETRVVWPDQTETHCQGLAINRLVTVHQASGQCVSEPVQPGVEGAAGSSRGKQSGSSQPQKIPRLRGLDGMTN